MFGRAYYFLFAVAVVLGVATFVWADAGYLPEAGPVALRFQVLIPPVAEWIGPSAQQPPLAPVSLPTPPMPSLPTPPASSGSSPFPNGKPDNGLVIAPMTNGPPLEYDARDPVTAPQAAYAPDIVISPQMLVKYFVASTNGVTNADGIGGMTPFGFTPPPPALPVPTVTLPSIKPSYSIPP